jgi:hypothetical protein
MAYDPVVNERPPRVHALRRASDRSGSEWSRKRRTSISKQRALSELCRNALDALVEKTFLRGDRVQRIRRRWLGLPYDNEQAPPRLGRRGCDAWLDVNKSSCRSVIGEGQFAEPRRLSRASYSTQ